MHCVYRMLVCTLLFLVLSAFRSPDQNDGAQTAESSARQGVVVLRVSAFPVREKALQMHDAGFEIVTVDDDAGTFDVMVAHTDRSYLEAIGLGGLRVEIFETFARDGIDDTGYHTLAQLNTRLHEIAAAYPAIVQLHVIGETFRKRPIYAVKLSDNVARDEHEPVLLFDFHVHAREVITSEVGLGLIEDLSAGYAEDALIRKWVDGFELWIIPRLNPDGSDLVTHRNKMHRKNGHFNGPYVPWMLTPGVDINRNYPHNWNGCAGSSGQTNADTYRGKAAGSENETQAILTLAEKIQPFFYLSMHAYGEMVLLPYGCENVQPPEHTTHHRFASELAQTLPREKAKGFYRVGRAFELLYPVDGDAATHMAATYGSLALTLEVTDAGFHPDAELWVGPTQDKMAQGFSHIFETLLHGPVVRGRVIEGKSKLPIDAQVTRIVGDHGRSVPHRSVDGHFYWYVDTNEAAQFIVEAEGYDSVTVTTMIMDGPLDLVVSLTKHKP